MNKKLPTYLCHACGCTTNKWSGKCPTCNEWGGLEEMNINENSPNGLVNFAKILQPECINNQHEDYKRIRIGINEFDTMIGGGLVRGSVILVGGDPGIGKSTLLLQITNLLSQQSLQCLYISGEESAVQIKIRANRLGIENSTIKVLSSTSLESVCATILSLRGLDFVIIDSIQTMCSEKISSSMGSIAQVKLCTHELVTMAKSNNIILVLVGHITKDGTIAGPKFLEHMVDTVLYFEGEQNYRIIRSVKNRYGATNEVAVFEMVDIGLREVENPSAFFLNNQNRDVSGSVIFAGVEGTRPLLIEVQALLAHSYMPMPRRAVVGWDFNRLSMIIAVLSARCGINMGDREVYLNVVGGLKLQDPSADLAVATALISVFYNKPLKRGTIVFGEIGLTGEIRVVPHIEIRLKEAQKLGFTVAIIPDQEVNEKLIDCIQLLRVRYLRDVMEILG